MARKGNINGSKIRHYGGGGLSKHRESGKSKPNKMQRILLTRDRNQAADRRTEQRAAVRPPMYDSVQEAFTKRG